MVKLIYFLEFTISWIISFKVKVFNGNATAQVRLGFLSLNFLIATLNFSIIDINSAAESISLSPVVSKGIQPSNPFNNLIFNSSIN